MMNYNNLNLNTYGIQQADILRQTGPLTVFEGAGNSHFSHVEGLGFHATTQIPGLGRNEGLDRGYSVHDHLIDFRW